MQNKPDAAKPAMTLWLTIEDQRRRVVDLERSTTDRNSKMTDYEIVDTNAENIGSCSFCGYKDANNLGHRRKTE